MSCLNTTIAKLVNRWQHSIRHGIWLCEDHNYCVRTSCAMETLESIRLIIKNVVQIKEKKGVARV